MYLSELMEKLEYLEQRHSIYIACRISWCMQYTRNHVALH